MAKRPLMFDTHTHLNFQAFQGKVDRVIEEAHKDGVSNIVVVGTNVENSKKAIEIAQKFDGVYAAVGIHPHHIFEHKDTPEKLDEHLKQIEELLKDEKVVAVGETGVDRHIYTKTKHKRYGINDKFIKLQKKAFAVQIKLALKYQKSLIIHNREAVPDLLEILNENWNNFFEGRAVFHMCEPDERLLSFAIKHNVYIGIDGDITYDKEKQEFVKKMPLDLLVLETDSPFLTAEGFEFPNTPANLNFISEFIANILKIEKGKFKKITFGNSQKLFRI